MGRRSLRLFFLSGQYCGQREFWSQQSGRVCCDCPCPAPKVTFPSPWPKHSGNSKDLLKPAGKSKQVVLNSFCTGNVHRSPKCFIWKGCCEHIFLTQLAMECLRNSSSTGFPDQLLVLMCACFLSREVGLCKTLDL